MKKEQEQQTEPFLHTEPEKTQDHEHKEDDKSDMNSMIRSIFHN